MNIEKIDNIENYVVLTYPQFTAIVNGIECRIFGVCHNGSNLEEIECIDEQTDEDIFHELHPDIQFEITVILDSILKDENNLTY